MSTAKILMKNSGFSIPQVGLGVYLMDTAEATKSVTTALENGYRHIDSASFYHNEKQVVDSIDSFLKATPSGVSREDIFYTTKIWPAQDETYESALKKIDKSCKIASKIGYIDLLLVHYPAGDKESRLEIWRAMQDFAKVKKVRSIGVSNYGIHHIKELLSWKGLTIRPAVNQVEINPWLQRADLVSYCDSEGIVIEAYSPLTRGMRLDDPELTALAAKYKISPAQVLVSWNVSKGWVVLPKSVTKERIIDNLKAADVKMSEADIEGLGDPKDYYVTMPSWDPVSWA